VSEYRLLDLTTLVIERARKLLEHHPLRAYDSVQLASALSANDVLVAAGQSVLTFLAADDRLLAAARAEG
jgi:predicted nucleic acid-binding protein